MQNICETTWGFVSEGRMIITDTCHMFYLYEVIKDKNKKKNGKAPLS